MALLNLSGESARSAARVEMRTLGGVVAENVAAEAMIAASLPVGETSGEVEMAGRVWRWRRTVSGTEVPGMGRIDKREGFTLVEVLVALAMFALLAGAGFLLLSQTIDARFIIRAETERTGDLQRLRALLKADLAQAAPRRTRGPTGRPLPRALMGAQAPGDPVLVLVRNGWSNPDSAPRPSLQRVEYRVIDDRLERSVAPYLDGARAGAPQVLYRGVSDVSVTFIQDGSEASAFLASSDRPLPDAVRIVMTVKGLGRLEQLFLAAAA
ncbi:hypothetical protein LTR94_025065 [Friedmanniomyces endolithicus]|nr:hypothetical protein LTR94_025065 [Friedmanniomyces endolithicus]